jgi:ferredoxin-type protein NapF
MADNINPSRRAFLRGRIVTGAAASAETPLIVAFGDTCIARQNVVCRTCSDFCDASAIRFSPRLGGAALPELVAEKCTGCGACIPVCPGGAIRLHAPANP